MTRLEPLDAWRRRGANVTVSGRSLFRVAQGDGGTPVVLVHGFPTSAYDYSSTLPLLAAKRRALAIDLLGFGLSEKPWPHDYAIGEQADLLLAWLEQEGIRRAHVLAHDMGVTVVQEVLARRLEGKPTPELASLVLLNGGLIVEKIRPILAQRLLRSRTFGRFFARLIGRRGFGHSLRSIANPARLPSEEELDALWELLVANDGKRIYPSAVRYMDERVTRRDRWRRATLEHAIPMRLVWGDADPISPWSMVDEILRERPATDAVRLPGTGHYPQVEEPERVAAAANEWFERHP